MSKSKIAFFLTGSISAFKACQVISRLVQDGHEVQCVATAAALRFVGKATLEGLTSKPVLSDLWEDGRAMDHIHLSRWSDWGLICPASANSLAKIAHGLADDAVSSTILAWPKGKSLYIFPAMNSQMLAAEATQANLRLLQERGFHVTPTAQGNLACGETGEGRLLEPDLILQTVLGTSTPIVSRGRVLITAGATREAIDGVRYISNVSTGQTGAALADLFTQQGWNVTFLHGQDSQRPKQSAHQVAFKDFLDLERRLQAELDQRDYAAVIHAAAVSDFSIENAEAQTKLSSQSDLTLKMKRNPKILPRLKSFSRKRGLKVIGFKLTMNAEAPQTVEQAREILGENVDAVVANDWSQVTRDRTRHPGFLVTSQGASAFDQLSDLAQRIHDLILSNEGEHLP